MPRRSTARIARRPARQREGVNLLIAGVALALTGLAGVIVLGFVAHQDTHALIRWLPMLPIAVGAPLFAYGLARASGSARTQAGATLAVLACALFAPLAGMDASAWDGALPTTDAEWRKLKGTVVEVRLNAAENQTRIILTDGQTVAVVPHPEDTWFSNWRQSTHQPVTWQGDLTQPAGWTKQMQVKGYPEAHNNGVGDNVKKQGTHVWINLANLDRYTWTGPGMLVFRGCLYGNQGTGQGTIRVKLVPLTMPVTAGR